MQVCEKTCVDERQQLRIPITISDEKAVEPSAELKPRLSAPVADPAVLPVPPEFLVKRQSDETAGVVAEAFAASSDRITKNDAPQAPGRADGLDEALRAWF